MLCICFQLSGSFSLFLRVVFKIQPVTLFLKKVSILCGLFIVVNVNSWYKMCSVGVRYPITSVILKSSAEFF